MDGTFLCSRDWKKGIESSNIAMIIYVVENGIQKQSCLIVSRIELEDRA